MSVLRSPSKSAGTGLSVEKPNGTENQVAGFPLYSAHQLALDGLKTDRSAFPSPSKSNFLPEAPAWLTVNVCPETVTVAVRACADELAATVNDTVPLPLCVGDVICVHDASLVAR